MLDYAIAFFLGLVAAALVTLALLPAVSARAHRLIRRQMEASLPLSMTEVRAAQDHLRAGAAITHRRLEQRLEREREQRHQLMADYGRQSERLRRVEALLGVDPERLSSTEQSAASAHRELLAVQQDVASLKAELAAARVTIALRDDVAGEHARVIDQTREHNDNLRIEVVALRTKLGAAEEGEHLRQRELHQALDDIAARDDRLAMQAIDLLRRETAIGALEGRASALDRDLHKAVERHEAAEAQRADLETRLVGLSGELRRKDAALAERDARLAIVSGREAELIAELNRLRRGAGEPSEFENKIAALKTDRARLQAEVANLRQEAHDSWLAIEADNRMLRREMAQIAAAIAREAANRPATGTPAQDRVAANDETGSSSGALPG